MDKYFELTTLGLLSPATIATYVSINYLLHPHPISAAIILPSVMTLLIWLVIMAATPHQRWTSIAFSGLLTVTAVGGILHDYEGLCTPFYIAGMVVFIFFVALFVVFLFLATKGVERQDMGHLGKVADGIEVVFNAIRIIIFDTILGIGCLVFDIMEGCGVLGLRMRYRLGKVFGITGDTTHLDAEARAQACPPSYDVSTSDFYYSKV